MRGRAVAEFYMLGVQKAATSSYAAVLQGIGFETAGAGPACFTPWSIRKDVYRQLCEKEMHIFGATSLCTTYSCAGDTGVTAASRDSLANWTSYACGERDNVTLADFTPDYLRIFELPRLMAELYRPVDTRRLSFMVILREPLARMHSSYYYKTCYNTWNASNFSEVIARTAAKLPGGGGRQGYAQVIDRADALAIDPDFDCWYRSAYGLQFSQWLDGGTFDPAQFVLMPMTWLLENIAASVRLLATAFPQLRMDASRAPNELPQDNEGDNKGNSHPSLAQEQPQAPLASFNASYIVPDTRRLASVLAVPLCAGLTIGGLSADDAGCGFADSSSVAESIEAHLHASW